jgi:dCTP deaminase
MLLNDIEIAQYVHKYRMISPFTSEKVKIYGPSYGLSSAGYDCSLDGEYWLPKPSADIVDLKTITKDEMLELFDKSRGPAFTLLPGMFVLLVTKEWFRIPRTIKGKCMGKSTLRRVGMISDITPLEPGWEGRLVLELNFTFPRPVRIHEGMGLCQVEFETINEPRKDYAAGGGKYQGQIGITPGHI